jgi:hypothetical protein
LGPIDGAILNIKDLFDLKSGEFSFLFSRS